MLADLKLFQMLQAEMDLLTDVQMQIAARKLEPATDSEKMIGLVERDDLRKLYVVARVFKRHAAHMKADAEMHTDEELERLRAECWKFAMLEKLALDLFWYGLKAELNCWAESARNAIGVREEWRVVISEKDHSHTTLGALLQRLTGQE